jgi:MFS family permease
LSDKHGNFKVYKWSMVVGVVCALYAIVCRSASWYTLVFVLQGLSASGVGIVAMNLVMELAGSAKRIGVYSSFYSALTSIPRAIAPVIGSLIAGGLGYIPLFTTCVIAIVLALWITLAHRHDQPTGLDTLDHAA